jgi:hypothetical protein
VANNANVKNILILLPANGYVLVEGWNEGRRLVSQDYVLVTPYPDFDVEGIHAYAKQGVKMIMHHDWIPTTRIADKSVYERYMMLKKWLYILPKGENH